MPATQGNGHNDAGATSLARATSARIDLQLPPRIPSAEESPIASAWRVLVDALVAWRNKLEAAGIGTRGAFGGAAFVSTDPSADARGSNYIDVAGFPLPLTRNDGTFLTREELLDFFDDCRRTCGGLTARLGFGFAASKILELDVHLWCSFWDCELSKVAELVERWRVRLDQRRVDILVTRPEVLTLSGSAPDATNAAE